jgi:hypothetical protein
MKVIRFLLMSLSILGVGCAVTPSGPGVTMLESDVITPRTYDYTVNDASKTQLFQRARNFFALSFGNSKSVIRVEDPDAGLIIGKGAAEWRIENGSWAVPFISCASEYELRFMAKDGRARLQLTLIDGAPIFSRCSGWSRPTVSGYEKILRDFDDFSHELELELQGGGSSSSFNNF